MRRLGMLKRFRVYRVGPELGLEGFCGFRLSFGGLGFGGFGGWGLGGFGGLGLGCFWWFKCFLSRSPSLDPGLSESLLTAIYGLEALGSMAEASVHQKTL